MKKGITPIIAVIILLLITLALASMAWVFFSGYMSGLTSGNFLVNNQLSGCSGTDVSIWITNMGTEPLDMGQITCLISGTGFNNDQCSDRGLSIVSGTIQPDQVTEVVTGTLAEGSYTVSLALGSLTQSVDLYCSG